MAIDLTQADFQSTVEGSDKAVLVDFWAAWCGPCRHQGQILEKWAAQNEDKVIIAKVNVDQENAIAAQFGITSIPTLILFSGGKEAGRVVGVQRESDLDAMVAKV
ncbi:MAG: thioredoxin [Planctomycetes bacterium]|nr:thioredoxin [Planctomycetota bacterium]